MGITTNNMAKLGAIRQGLMLAWDLGFKFIQLKIDFVIVLSWLTTTTDNFPTNVFPLIFDCKSLMERAWEVQVRYVYCEANKCADALAKWGNHQQQLLNIYDTAQSQFCISLFCKGYGRPRDQQNMSLEVGYSCDCKNSVIIK